MATIATRLPTWLHAELRALFREHGEGPSQGLRRLIEEWWTTNHLPHIEFRDGPAGRRASVRGGPDVWEVIQTWIDYDRDTAALQQHYDWLEAAELDQALQYYDRFPETVDAILEENRRLARYAGVSGD